MPKGKQDISGHTFDLAAQKELVLAVNKLMFNTKVEKGSGFAPVSALADARAPVIDNANRARIKIVPEHKKQQANLVNALKRNLDKMDAAVKSQYDITIEQDVLRPSEIFLVFRPKLPGQQFKKESSPSVPEVQRNAFKDIVNYLLDNYKKVEAFEPHPAPGGVLATFQVDSRWKQYERELHHYAMLCAFIVEQRKGGNLDDINRMLSETVRRGSLVSVDEKRELVLGDPLPKVGSRQQSFFGKVPTRYPDLVKGLAVISDEDVVSQFEAMESMLDELGKKEPIPAPVRALNVILGRTVSTGREEVSPSDLTEKEGEKLHGPGGMFEL